MTKEKILPMRMVKIIFQLISFLFIHALYPFDVAWIRPWRTIAGPTGRRLINTPIKIRPPSIPNIEDKNAVAKVEIKIKNEIKTICNFYLKWNNFKIQNTLSSLSIRDLVFFRPSKRYLLLRVKHFWPIQWLSFRGFKYLFFR